MPDLKDSLVNSLIGIGSAVDGNIDVDGMLRVDGDLRGSIRATGKVVIGEAGRVEASVRAQSAIIGGLVKGDVYVTDRARLLSGAVVLGNVFAPHLEAEDGAVVHGEIAATGRPESADEELKLFIERHGDAIRFLGRFRAGDFTDPAAGPAILPPSHTEAHKPGKRSTEAHLKRKSGSDKKPDGAEPPASAETPVSGGSASPPPSPEA